MRGSVGKTDRDHRGNIAFGILALVYVWEVAAAAMEHTAETDSRGYLAAGTAEPRWTVRTITASTVTASDD